MGLNFKHRKLDFASLSDAFDSIFSGEGTFLLWYENDLSPFDHCLGVYIEEDEDSEDNEEEDDEDEDDPDHGDDGCETGYINSQYGAFNPPNKNYTRALIMRHISDFGKEEYNPETVRVIEIWQV